MTHGQNLDIAKLHAECERLRSKEGTSIAMIGDERCEFSAYEVYAYSKKVVRSQVSCTSTNTKDLSLDELRKTVDAVIRFECDNGTVYVVEHAYMSTPPQGAAVNRGIACEFRGAPARKELL